MSQFHHTQHGGDGDFQMWQQQMMYKQLQEFQRQQHAQQVDHGARMQPSFGQLQAPTKSVPADQLPAISNEMPNNEAAAYAWQHNFASGDPRLSSNSQMLNTGSNTNWEQYGGAPAMGNFMNGSVFPNTQSQPMRPMGLATHQMNQSFYPIPATSRGGSVNQYPQFLGIPADLQNAMTRTALPLPRNSSVPEKSFTPSGKTMEDCAATPVRRPADPSSPSPTPSPLSLRQWRPAAQRNLRNQWSRLLAAKTRWLDAATKGRSHASMLVNAHLSCSNMPGMDLGVLKDMPGIRDRASTKLAHKEVQCREMLLSAYKEMVFAVSDLVKASRAMRCFSKVSSGSPLVRFTDCQDDLNDSGDGGGAPVYRWLSMLEFENLAQELVEMFVSELQLKRLIVLDLLSINLKEGAGPSLEWSDELYELYDGELYKFQSIGLGSGDSFPLPENWRADVWQARHGHTPSHEGLQVYLTSWLANVNIKMSRIDEIFELVGEEMQIKLC